MGDYRDGWYWVKASDDHPWECCEYEEGLGWWIEEFEANRSDDWWPVVGERIPYPD